MKFTTTTTSSLLLASMALSSPSLSVAAPTRLEVSTSPNPAGTPSIRQFPPSPRFDSSVGHSPNINRAPAFRTGPGSPRRSISSRMVKVSKRQNAQNAPNTGLLSNIVGPIMNTLTNTLSGVPIVGGLFGNVGTHEQDASATVAPLSNVGHADLSGLPVLGDVGHSINESPSGSVPNPISGLGLSLPASVGGVSGVLDGLPLSSALTGIGQPLGVVDGDGNPASGWKPPREPTIVPLRNGGFLINDNGVLREVHGLFAAASAPVSTAAGPQPSAGASTHPSLAVDDGKPSLPGVSVNPPSPSVSPPVSPPVSKVLVHPATPTGTPVLPNTPTHADPPVSSSTIHAVSHIAVTPVAAASIPDSNVIGDISGDIPGDIPGDLDGLVPGLIHGMSAP